MCANFKADGNKYRNKTDGALHCKAHNSANETNMNGTLRIIFPRKISNIPLYELIHFCALVKPVI